VGVHRRFGAARSLRLLYNDRSAARNAVDEILEMDFARIIPAHGPIIEEQAKQRLSTAFLWLRKR